MSEYNISAVIQLLNPDNTLSAHRMLAHSIGMAEAVIYSALISKQIYYSQNDMLFEGEWFYSTISDLQESTTFGAKAQKTAISNLISNGMIECRYKGMPAKRYFRIIDDTENLMRLIEEGIEISERISGRTKDRTAEKSQQEQQENNTAASCSNLAAASCTYPEDISCSIPKALSCSHPAENKTKDNKPKENNPNINQSINPSGETAISQKVEIAEKIDRQNKQPMKFHEVLDAIGVEWWKMTATEPVSEKHFEYWSEQDRMTNKCQIPYYLKNDKKAMKAALKYLCGYSYYFPDDSCNEERSLWETIICCIADMAENDGTRICGQAVRYNEIIDRLNEIIKRYSLVDCFSGFEEKWQELLPEKEFTHQKAYLRSCLWNWLCDYELERSKL